METLEIFREGGNKIEGVYFHYWFLYFNFSETTPEGFLGGMELTATFKRLPLHIIYKNDSHVIRSPKICIKAGGLCNDDLSHLLPAY